VPKCRIGTEFESMKGLNQTRGRCYGYLSDEVV
jgi:hypothetical protein